MDAQRYTVGRARMIHVQLMPEVSVTWREDRDEGFGLFAASGYEAENVELTREQLRHVGERLIEIADGVGVVV